MGAWDNKILNDPVNTDFLDELVALDDDEIVETVADACKLLLGDPHVTDDDRANGLCAATIAAIWAGAPYSAGDVVEEYPFIRELIGSGDESLYDDATSVLEEVDEEYDTEPYIEALGVVA